MNATLVLVSSAWLMGADTPLPPAGPPVLPGQALPYTPAAYPTAAYPTAGCNDCGSSAYHHYPSWPTQCCEEERLGLFGRLRAKFARKGSRDCCDPCASYSAPVYTGFTTAACDTCDNDRPGLLARLRSRFHKNDCDVSHYCAPMCHSHYGCGTGYGYGYAGATGCALPPVPGSVMPTPPIDAPQQMPGTTPQQMPNTPLTPTKPIEPKKTTSLDLPSLPQVQIPTATTPETVTPTTSRVPF